MYWCRFRARAVAMVVALSAACALSVSAQTAPAGRGPAFGGPPVTGKITSVSDGGFVVALNDGTNVPVRLSDRTRIVTRTPAAFDSISKGVFLGVAATREADGRLTAVSIGILPGAFRRAGRTGQFPMANGEVMTNAPVTEIVAGVGDHVLTMEYAGQTVTIDVPSGARIEKVAPAGREALAVGAAVSVRGRPGSGGMDALFVTVFGS